MPQPPHSGRKLADTAVGCCTSHCFSSCTALQILGRQMLRDAVTCAGGCAYQPGGSVAGPRGQRAGRGTALLCGGAARGCAPCARLARPGRPHARARGAYACSGLLSGTTPWLNSVCPACWSASPSAASRWECCYLVWQHVCTHCGMLPDEVIALLCFFCMLGISLPTDMTAKQGVAAIHQRGVVISKDHEHRVKERCT